MTWRFWALLACTVALGVVTWWILPPYDWQEPSLTRRRFWSLILGIVTWAGLLALTTWFILTANRGAP